MSQLMPTSIILIMYSSLGSALSIQQCLMDKPLVSYAKELSVDIFTETSLTGLD